MKFNLLTVNEIVRLTEDSVQISFEVSENLQEEYHFLPGQYITLNINDERRDYSLCTSPNDKKWSVGIKAQPNGKVSNYLFKNVKVGDQLEVSTPNGRFVIPSKPNEKRTLLAFTAGSGITPIMSMLEYTLQTEKWVNFHIFYVNRNEDSIMFKDRLTELKQLYPTNVFIHHFYTRQNQENFIYNGRIDEKKFDLILNQIIDINEVDEAMICGPEQMILTLAKKINDAGIIGKHIHFEIFNPSIKAEDIFTKHDEGPQTVKVSVTLDGETTDIVWDRGKNLIDAMLDADIDAPYSCKGGVCSSCMCKVTKGEVHIGDNYVLTDSDYEEGMALACISRPKTETLAIDFDDV